MFLFMLIVGTPAAILTNAVLTLTRRLVATRHDKTANEEPWSDRLYSAAKRATLSWCAVTAFAVVAYGVFGLWDILYLTGWEQFFLLCGIPAAAFAWGMEKPRIYRDGLERDRNGRYDAWVVLSFLMFLVFAPTFAIMRTIAPFRTDSYGDGRRMEIASKEWNSRRFRLAQPLASALIAASDASWPSASKAMVTLSGRSPSTSFPSSQTLVTGMSISSILVKALSSRVMR